MLETVPAWTPLFLIVAGVVVDVGVQTSHAATIARELGIPAVVGVTEQQARDTRSAASANESNFELFAWLYDHNASKVT